MSHNAVVPFRERQITFTLWRVRGLLRFLITVQLVVAVALALTTDEHDAPSQAASAPSVTTTAAPAATSTTPTTAVKRAPVVTTPTTKPPPTLHPPQSGKYLYRLRFTDDGETREFSGSHGYFTAKEEVGELRQVEFGGDDRSGTTRSSYAWRADGLYLRSFHQYEIFDDDYRCDVEPDLLLYPSPLTVGREWTTEGSCHAQGAPTQFKSTSRVARTQRVTVANRSVTVHVIETRGSVPQTEQGGTFHTLDYFSVDLGLSVREETTYRYDVPGSQEDQETFELLSLDSSPLDKAPPA